jgi:ATP-dependent DNA helicase RecG
MLTAKLNGYKSILMAPTEILANQHFETLNKLGLDVGIVTGSKKIIDSGHGQNDIIVGTHALLNEKIDIKNLGLIVIDEQHRFGVEQRAKLSQKGKNPHILTMTATPIPRTVALTLYGDLDLSIIDQMPHNRLPIKTWVVPNEKRDKAYEWIKKQNTQCFIICPFIEESETMQSVKAATVEFEKLKKVFDGLRLGLVHGKIKDKDRVLTDFRNRKLDILVATPVVEVGIDIPQATIIMVESADRFGLAQLHQLRGRVGRGDQQSYCLLFSENEANKSRLKYLEKLNNGLKLAEVDFKFRGPGQRFGVAQHGKWGLTIANFDDLELIEKTNQFVKIFSLSPSNFPLLMKKIQDKCNFLCYN